MHTPLKVIGLSKDYNGKSAVKNISLEVEKMKLLEFLARMVVEKQLQLE